MKTYRKYKLINLFLLISILSHTTYLHNLLDSYVLCYGSDGHLEVENIDDCSDCKNVASSDQMSNKFTSNFQENNCNDISLDGNCFEDVQYLIKNVKILTSQNNSSVELFYSPDQKVKFTNTNIFVKNYNPALQNYSTVLLII